MVRRPMVYSVTLELNSAIAIMQISVEQYVEQRITLEMRKKNRLKRDSI